MKTPMQACRDLESRFARWSHIQGVMSVLGWDRDTVMPEGGSGARGEQMATLAAIAHETLTDPAVGDLLDAAGDKPLSDWQRANLHEMRRLRVHATSVPAELVTALARAVSA